MPRSASTETDFCGDGEKDAEAAPPGCWLTVRSSLISVTSCETKGKAAAELSPGGLLRPGDASREDALLSLSIAWLLAAAERLGLQIVELSPCPDLVLPQSVLAGSSILPSLHTTSNMHAISLSLALSLPLYVSLSLSLYICIHIHIAVYFNMGIHCVSKCIQVFPRSGSIGKVLLWLQIFHMYL